MSKLDAQFWIWAQAQDSNDFLAFVVKAYRKWLTVMPYEDYLKTPEWQAIRNVTIERANYRCQVCNAAGPLDVHHRTYERRGQEQPGDVIALCRQCHELFHASGRKIT